MPRTETCVLTSRPLAVFSGQVTNLFHVEVDNDQEVTVTPWDSVAGHFTICHDMTEEQTATVIATAKRQAPYLFRAGAA